MAGMTSGASSASTTTAQRALRATVTPMPASRRRAAAGAGVCSRWRRPRLVIGAWASDRAAGDLHGVIAVLRPQRGDDVGACAVAHAGDGAPAPDAVVRRARFTILHLHGFLLWSPRRVARRMRDAARSPRVESGERPVLPRRMAPRGDAAVHRGGGDAARGDPVIGAIRPPPGRGRTARR
jgi:hypothetical protein